MEECELHPNGHLCPFSVGCRKRFRPVPCCLRRAQLSAWTAFPPFFSFVCSSILPNQFHFSLSICPPLLPASTFPDYIKYFWGSLCKHSILSHQKPGTCTIACWCISTHSCACTGQALKGLKAIRGFDASHFKCDAKLPLSWFCTACAMDTIVTNPLSGSCWKLPYPLTKQQQQQKEDKPFLSPEKPMYKNGGPLRDAASPSRRTRICSLF